MKLARGIASALGLLLAHSALAQDLSPNAQLLAAARQGDLPAVTRLLDAGAAVDSRNRLGDTPLLIALKNGYKDVAQLAVARGADVNLANLSKVTPLMAASFSGNAGLVKLLLEKGADRSPEDRVGKTAMVYAAGLGHTGVVELLLARGESPRAAITTISRADVGGGLRPRGDGQAPARARRGRQSARRPRQDRAGDGDRRETQGGGATAPPSRCQAIDRRASGCCARPS